LLLDTRDCPSGAHVSIEEKTNHQRRSSPTKNLPSFVLIDCEIGSTKLFVPPRGFSR
jgi:hypothetical protein